MITVSFNNNIGNSEKMVYRNGRGELFEPSLSVNIRHILSYINMRFVSVLALIAQQDGFHRSHFKPYFLFSLMFWLWEV